VEYDVAIVGAGPAGSTTARSCAKAGLRTLLLEKEKLPRHKPCGGGLTENALSLLDFDVRDVIEGECYDAVFNYEDITVDIKTPFRVTSFTSRDRFDMLLTEKAVDAGTELRDSEKVTGVSRTKDSVRIRTDGGEYDAHVVVGADGANSVVAGCVRGRLRSSEVGLALEAQIPATPVQLEEFDTLRAYLGLVPQGYGWVFPKRDRITVGIGCRLSSFRNPHQVFRGFMRKVGLDEDTAYHAHLLPFGGYDRPIVSDRVLLVGDAAGFVDPFSGEGIAYAIKSGLIAAEAIGSAYEKGDLTKAGLYSYERACYSSFGKHLRAALRVSDFAYGHMNLFGRALARNRSFWYKSLEVYANRITYEEFMLWLLPRVPYYGLQMMQEKVHPKADASL
jgi:geranylgeranyl reductase family protein